MTMLERYKSVQDHEEHLYDWFRGLFLKERMLSAEMMELMLEAVEATANTRVDDQLLNVEEVEDLKQSADMLVAVRMFNDFEAAKLLILHGLPDQTYGLMRDAVECMMMMHLFHHDPERAKRWLTSLKEYSPGIVKSRLQELDVELLEYDLYGTLSTLAHLNLLGSLATVAEVKVGESGVFRQHHFGGFRNEKWAARQFQFLLLLQYLALATVFARTYGAYINDLGDWVQRVHRLLPNLQELNVPINEEDSPDNATKYADPRLQEFITKRLRLKFEPYAPRTVGETLREENA